MMRTSELFALLSLVTLCAACSSNSDEPAKPSRAELLDPKGCAKCHADHYRDWASSMHAYASDDPVMLAANALGQRQTKGALGDFCVKCHAPMALREGATKDGLNLATVPQELKGVTCFFCHTVDAVQATHDDQLHSATDEIMRGPIGDPAPTPGHESGYSALHDRDRLESSELCGSCHDLHLGELAVERTYAEWQTTVFAHAGGGATCGQCHMAQSTGLTQIAQVPGAPLRRSHDHGMPALDVSLVSQATADLQKPKVQATLDVALQSALCVGQDGTIDVILENVAAGHGWPSGGAQHRRAWVELIAYAKDEVIYQTGVVADGKTLASTPDHDRWEIRECLLDASGKETLLPWDTTSLESTTLEGLLTFDPSDPRYYQTHVYRRFPNGTTLKASPDRVTMRVLVQPIALEIIDALIGTGDLDPSVRARMPTFETARVEWTPAQAKLGYFEGTLRYTCVSSSNLNFAADKTPAPRPVKCAP
jgi:hypothetical protein